MRQQKLKKMRKEELGREVPFGVERQEQQEQLEGKFSPEAWGKSTLGKKGWMQNTSEYVLCEIIRRKSKAHPAIATGKSTEGGILPHPSPPPPITSMSLTMLVCFSNSGQISYCIKHTAAKSAQVN